MLLLSEEAPDLEASIHQPTNQVGKMRGQSSWMSVLSRLDCRLYYWILFEAVSTTPVLGLPFEEGAHGAKIALVAEEVCLLRTFGPEVDGIRQGLDGLSMTSDEGTAKVDMLQMMLLTLQVSDLANIVTDGR